MRPVSECSNDTSHEFCSNIEAELQRARADAQETLEALLKFSEGVRLITRHMQTATSDEASDCEEDCKSEQPDDNPSLRIERMVSETCLKGTVFGTDLLRLFEAAHHVRDYARMVTEESTVSTRDILAAQRTAKRAIQRTKKAESLALHLHRQNQGLRLQLDQLSSEKKCLVQEVKALRQQAAATRKMDMERLLQQHVVGAILLHEEQLKAMATAAQQNKLLRKKKRAEEEEEKKEEDDNDMEVIKAEDCLDNTISQRQETKKTFEVVSTLGNEHDKTSHKEVTEIDKNAPETGEELKGELPAKAAETNSTEARKSSSPDSQDSNNLSPIILLPSVGRMSPPPPPVPSSNEGPSSSRSIASNQPTFTRSITPPPQQPRENVGSKVFNFLFHPEKIGQQKLQQEMERQQQLEKQLKEQEGDQPRKQQLVPRPAPMLATKLNPLLALNDLVLEKEDASVDATAPTQVATTPGSTCASTSLRARSLSNDRLASADGNQSTPYRTPEPKIPSIIPDCVSFSDDALSVESNLPSPKFPSSCRRSLDVTMDDDDDDNDEDHAIPELQLYKDFKMFRSLAIPADDEIDEYHQSRDQEMKTQ